MKFWSRTTVVWLKPFVYVWKSSWVKTPNCCKLSQRTEKLELKIHWKANLLVFDYWFFCCCCHIWSHRLTILSKSRGFFLHWFGQDQMCDFHPVKSYSNLSGCSVTSSRAEHGQGERDDFEVSFGIKSPSSPIPWLSGFSPTSAAGTFN